MRALVYECYFRNMYVKTVKTYREAEDWKKELPYNTYKDVVIDEKPMETEKEKAIRLARIAKRAEKRKMKRSK